MKKSEAARLQRQKEQEHLLQATREKEIQRQRKQKEAEQLGKEIGKGNKKKLNSWESN